MTHVPTTLTDAVTHKTTRDIHILKSTPTSLFLFLVFPGYFVYHVARPYLMPGSGIGWFTLALVLVVGWCFLGGTYSLLVGRQFSRRSLAISTPVYALIVVMGCVVLVNQFVGKPAHITSEGVLFILQIIVTTLGMFYIGRSLDGAKQWKKPTTILLYTTLMGAACIALFDPSAGVVTIPPGYSEDIHTAYLLTANYQGIARSVMYTGLLCIPYLRSRALKSSLILVYVGLLFLIGSRTDLFLFLIIVPFFVYFNFGLIRFVLFSLLFVLSVGSLVVWLDSDRLSLANAQMSLSERLLFFDVGIERLQSHFILGDYLGQLRDFEMLGAYIHNGLSMWSQFGIFAFLLYCGLIFGTLVYSLAFLMRRATGTGEVLFYIALTSFIGVLFSRAITWPMPALAWGIACCLLGRPGGGTHMRCPTER